MPQSDLAMLAPLEPVTDFQSFETSSGSVKVPMLLKETVCIGAFFTVPSDKICKFLPSSKLKPVVVARGRTIYAVAAYEYLDTSIGPYNEVAMGMACIHSHRLNIPFLPAIFDQAFSVGFYLCHLPVTTKIALDSGVEIWGFPKFLATVRFEESPSTRTCLLEADKRNILSLQVKKAERSKSETKDFTSFSVKGKTLLETAVHTLRLIWNSRRAESTSLELGDHPIGEELLELKKDWKLLRTFHAPVMRSVVESPQEIATLS